MGSGRFSLIAEAIMCSLFFSYTLKAYRDFRLPELPNVDLGRSLHRTDPLEPDGHILTDQIHQQLHYCGTYDDGSRLGISIFKVIDGVRKQWWLEKRSTHAVREANSLVDWLNEDVKDPQNHQWGWDRVPFFGPRSKVRFGEKSDAK